MPGAIAGKFQVGRITRANILGKFYAATDLAGRRPLTLKELDLAPRLERSDLQRLHGQFADEARRLASIDSPRIARVVDQACGGDSASIVLEAPAGPALRDFFAAMPPAERPRALVGAAADIISILAQLRRAGLTRINLIPDSFYLGADGRPLYLDRQFLDYATCERLFPGRWPEDPRFLAPEQAGGTTMDPTPADDEAAQVFSLGVLLHLLARGKTPFDAQSPQAARNLLVNTEAASIFAGTQAPLPEALGAAIDQALRRSRALRPQSLEEFRRTAQLPDPGNAEIAALILAPPVASKSAGKRRAEASIAASPEDRTDAEEEADELRRAAPPRWLAWAIGGAVLVVAAIAGIVVWALKRG